MKSLEELRVVDLRNELEKRGLDKTGIKAVLLERLKKAVLAEGENPDDIEVNIPSKNNGSRRSIEENHEMGDKNCNGANESLSDDPLKDPGETFDLQDSDEILLSNEEDAFKGDMQDSGGKKLIPVDGKESDVFTAMVEKPELSQLLDDLQHKEIKPETDPCQKKVVMKKDELAAPSESSTAEPLIEEEEEFLEDEGESRITREDYVQRMEDDSINLLLEDDDKMLDYEENDRNDMDDCPSSECKEKNEDSNVESVDKSSKEDEVETEANKLELQKKTDDSEKSCSSKNEDSTIEKADHEKADKKQTSSSSASVSKNLWVSGLASNTRAQDLKLLFCKHGKVLSAKIVTNARTPGARCYGFVTLASVQDAARCITYLNRTELHGRMIQVEKAKGEPGGPIKISTLPTNLPTVTGKDSNEVDKKEDRAVSSIRDADKLRIRTSKEREESLDRRKKSLSTDRKERIRDGQDRTKPLHFDQMKTRNRPSRRSLLSRDERCRLSAKERVVDRRHEVRGNKRSPPTKRDVLSLSRIVEERERHRASTRGRLEREQEKRRRIEELELKNIEKRQKEEAERLRRERDKLRLEREKIEIQKQELLRLEREQQKLERERLERERDELRKQQLKYEQVRRGSKRPISDRREFFDDRKRGSSRNSERSPDLGSIRGIPRMSDKNLPQLPSRNLDQGLTRGSDRVTASRGLDRTTERSHYNDNNHRESHYPNSNSSDRGTRPSMRGARGSSHYEERRDRDREDRRPMESSVPRNKDSRDHRSSPSICRPVRDSHYNTSSLPGSSMMDAWHSGNAQHPPKNAPYSSGSNLMSVIAGTHIGNRGMEGTGSWKTSNAISTNERWGGNPGNRANANLIDQYRMGGQVPMNNIPVMSNVMPSDRFGGMGSFRK